MGTTFGQTRRSKLGYGSGGSRAVAAGTTTVMLTTTAFLHYDYSAAFKHGGEKPPQLGSVASCHRTCDFLHCYIFHSQLHCVVLSHAVLFSCNMWWYHVLLHNGAFPHCGASLHTGAFLQCVASHYYGTMVAAAVFFSPAICGVKYFVLLSLALWWQQPLPILTGKLDQKPAAAIAETDCVWDCNFSANIFISEASNGWYGQGIGKDGDKLFLVSARKTSIGSFYLHQASDSVPDMV